MLTPRSPDPQAIGGSGVIHCLNLLKRRTLRRYLALKMIMKTLLMTLMISGDRVRICWILLKVKTMIYNTTFPSLIFQTSVDVVLWQKIFIKFLHENILNILFDISALRNCGSKNKIFNLIVPIFSSFCVMFDLFRL